MTPRLLSRLVHIILCIILHFGVKMHLWQKKSILTYFSHFSFPPSQKASCKGSGDLQHVPATLQAMHIMKVTRVIHYKNYTFCAFLEYVMSAGSGEFCSTLFLH